MAEEPLGERVSRLEAILPLIQEDVHEIKEAVGKLTETSTKQKGAMAVIGGFAGYGATWLHKLWPGG